MEMEHNILLYLLGVIGFGVDHEDFFLGLILILHRIFWHIKRHTISDSIFI